LCGSGDRPMTPTLLAVVIVLAAQQSQCPTVTDADRRAFSAVSSFALDVDGDGSMDLVTPRTYSVKATGRPYQSGQPVTEWHWITFDLVTSTGKHLHSWFRYRYGSDVADYWCYAVIPCKTKSDILFYAGDDTSDETVLLHYTGSKFITRWMH